MQTLEQFVETNWPQTKTNPALKRILMQLQMYNPDYTGQRIAPKVLDWKDHLAREERRESVRTARGLQHG